MIFLQSKGLLIAFLLKIIMATDLGWIGFVNQLLPLKTEIEMDLGRRVQTFGDALSGLNGIEAADYPLILFNEETPVGDLHLPDNVFLRDTVSTDCYAINCIRSIRSDTPIIVTHSSPWRRNTQEVLEKYRAAGATDFYDWVHTRKEGSFVELLRRHL